MSNIFKKIGIGGDLFDSATHPFKTIEQGAFKLFLIIFGAVFAFKILGAILDKI